MQPAFADGHFLAADGAAGRDEVERGHTSGCSGITLIGQLTGAAVAVSPQSPEIRTLAATRLRFPSAA